MEQALGAPTRPYDTIGDVLKALLLPGALVRVQGQEEEALRACVGAVRSALILKSKEQAMTMSMVSARSGSSSGSRPSSRDLKSMVDALREQVESERHRLKDLEEQLRVKEELLKLR